MPPARLDEDTLNEVTALIATNLAGSRIPAITQHVRAALGSTFRVTLKRNTIIVYDATWTGNIVIDGNKLKAIGSPLTVHTNTAADKDSGTWELLLRNHTTGRLIHIASPDFTISLDLDGSTGLTHNLVVYFDSNLDPVVSNNSLDQVVDDMRRVHDAQIKGVPFLPGWRGGPGDVGFGTDLRGSNAVDYWTPSNAAYLSDTRYQLLAMWSEIFTAEDNRATHTWVQFRNWKLVVESLSGQWSVLNTINAANRMTADYFTPDYWAAGAAPVTGDANGIVLKPTPQNSNFIHFYGGGAGPYAVSNFDPADIKNLFCTVEHRLITDGSVDDRNQARYMWRIGCDALPYAGVPGNWISPMSFIPQVGGSAARLIKSSWGRTTFLTFGADVAYQGGRRAKAGTSTYGFSSGPSEAQVRADPPPL